MTTDKEILTVRDLMEHTGYKETKCRELFHAKGFPRCNCVGLRVYKVDFDTWFRGRQTAASPNPIHTTVR